MMNPYFWLFACYAFLITPVTAQISIRLEHGVYWKLQMQLAGLPIVRKRRETDGTQEETLKAETLLQGILSPKRRLAWTMVRDGSLARLIRGFRCQKLSVYARLSFQDAAATAMIYASVRTILEILGRCGILPKKISGHVEADFQARGTQICLQGIFSARLGRVMLAGIRLGISAIRMRARFAMEEEQYAASH